MTPSTTVLEYMAQHADRWGIVVKQAESEVAVINICVGAAHAGVRTLTPTSGGGFDLMSEGLSLAAMTETPLVVYLGQRPGPATGLPTRTAQSDLFLAIYASHGEAPRIVIAPHTPEEFWHAGWRAFNLADKYQCPVIVISDEYMAGSIHTCDVEPFLFKHVQIERGKLLAPEEVGMDGPYKRFALTEDGISPRALPGLGPKSVYLTTGDEHNEHGNITEDADITIAMQSKRLRKIEVARQQDMRAPFQFGPKQADVTLLSWGSSYGPVRQAMELLSKDGASVNMVHLVDLWPFPVEKVRAALAGAKRIVDIEGNLTGQLAQLLYAQTGIQVDQKILRFDGRPFTQDYILKRLEVK